MNVSPRIVSPTGPKGEEHVLPLFSAGGIAKVVASDDDLDDLVFQFEIPGHPNLLPTTSSDEGGLWTSWVELPYDPELDAVLIRVLVVDQSPAHNAETVLFRVELQ